MPWRQSIHIPPIGHSQPVPSASKVGNFLYSSQVSCADPATATPTTDPEQAAANVFANTANILAKAGGKPGDIVHMTVYAKDEACRAAINRQWLLMFPDEDDRPARHFHIEAGRAPDNLVTVEVIAVIEGA